MGAQPLLLVALGRPDGLVDGQGGSRGLQVLLVRRRGSQGSQAGLVEQLRDLAFLLVGLAQAS